MIPQSDCFCFQTSNFIFFFSEGKEERLEKVSLDFVLIGSISADLRQSEQTFTGSRFFVKLSSILPFFFLCFSLLSFFLFLFIYSFLLRIIFLHFAFISIPCLNFFSTFYPSKTSNFSPSSNSLSRVFFARSKPTQTSIHPCLLTMWLPYGDQTSRHVPRACLKPVDTARPFFHHFPAKNNLVGCQAKKSWDIFHFGQRCCKNSQVLGGRYHKYRYRKRLI